MDANISNVQSLGNEQDMYNVKVGETIKQLRQQRSLSQRELTKCDTPSETICSTKTLRRIEQGKVAPSIFEIKFFLSVFGVSMSEFESLVEGQDLLTFRNSFEEICNLLFDERYQEASRHLELLKEQKYCDPKNPQILQALLLCDGFFQRNLHKNLQASLDVLYSALRITVPSVISEDNRVKYGIISDRMFSLNEYRILNLIAIILIDLNQNYLATRIFKAMCKSLQNKKISSEIRNHFLPTTYYNLSDCFIDEKRYKEAFNVCEEGLEFCESIKNFKNFAKLLYNRAKSLYYMGDKESAAEGFKHSYSTFISLKRNEMASRVKTIVATKYQINL
ncbi:MAG: helix-turn-helix domain-containing protein [Defluviitaleaceae bacterium]|nr:helix-turn-helix domain-containing protein [Defluviitaleaceae bacterium]